MGVMVVTREMLAAKFETIFPHLDERQRRLLMGAEARALGHGGIRLVARVAGSARPQCRWASMSWRRGLSRWAGRAGRAGAASGRLTWIPGCAARGSRSAGTRPGILTGVLEATVRDPQVKTPAPG